MSKIKFKTTAEITLQNGKKLKLLMLDPEDFLNDVVPAGRMIVLITNKMKVEKGEFLHLEADESGVYIFIRSIDTGKVHVFNIDAIAAYADGREAIL